MVFLASKSLLSGNVIATNEELLFLAHVGSPLLGSQFYDSNPLADGPVAKLPQLNAHSVEYRSTAAVWTSCGNGFRDQAPSILTDITYVCVVHQRNFLPPFCHSSGLAKTGLVFLAWMMNLAVKDQQSVPRSQRSIVALDIHSAPGAGRMC
jgi:hypothetical protein